MTAAEAYRVFMAQPATAFAFGHGCTIGGHPEFAKIRARADALLAMAKIEQQRRQSRA